jgi:ADP-heptose:LPS heptosyltransferase
MSNSDPYIPAKPWPGDRPPRQILAIRLQAMGDMIITLPYLQALRNALPPETELHLLTRDEVDPVPRGIELFDKIFSIGGGRNFKKQVFYAAALLPQLLWQQYDVVLDLQNNPISRYVRRLLLPKAWSQFDKRSTRAAGERTRLTIEAALPWNLQPAFAFKLKQPPPLHALLSANGYNGSKLVLLNPAAAFPTRNWPIENYISFAEIWLQEFPDTQFLVLGTAFIRQKADQLKAALGAKLIDLTEKTTPLMAFAMLQEVQFMLTEDSGLMHMAWVSGVPLLALFGGTRSDWSRPLGPHTRLLDSSDLDCGNCMLAACPYATVHCLTRYSPAMVLEHSMRLLQTIASSPWQFHPSNG